MAGSYPYRGGSRGVIPGPGEATPPPAGGEPVAEAEEGVGRVERHVLARRGELVERPGHEAPRYSAASSFSCAVDSSGPACTPAMAPSAVTKSVVGIPATRSGTRSSLS